MAIIGLTTRAGSFPCIGELRKGGVKVSEKRPGPDLTFFRFTSKHPDAVEKFTQAFGDQPTKVDIYLPFPTAAENFDAWIEEWVGGGLKWRGDGETLVMWQKKDGTYSQEPKPQPQGGKQVGRLKVIIPQLGRLAYVTALTTSIHDIISMSETLAAYEALRGNLQGIPFVLSRVPRMVSTPSGEDGKRARREKWLWHLEAQPQWVMAQLSVMQQAALPKPSNLMLVDSGTGEIFEGEPLVYDDDEEGEILEHQPQQVTASPDFSTPAAKGRRTGQPMEAPALRDYMKNKAHGSTSAPSEKQLTYMRSSLSKAAGTPQKAKQVQSYLFGVDSSTLLTSGQVSAIIDWLGATADNEYTADPVSLQELERVCTAYLREQGQADLFPAPTPPPAPEQGTAGNVDGVAPLLDGVHYQALLGKTDPNVGDVIAALNGDNVTTPPIARGIIEQLYAEIKPTPATKLKPATAATMYEAVVIHLGDTVA